MLSNPKIGTKVTLKTVHISQMDDKKVIHFVVLHDKCFFLLFFRTNQRTKILRHKHSSKRRQQCRFNSFTYYIIETDAPTFKYNLTREATQSCKPKLKDEDLQQHKLHNARLMVISNNFCQHDAQPYNIKSLLYVLPSSLLTPL